MNGWHFVAAAGAASSYTREVKMQKVRVNERLVQAR